MKIITPIRLAGVPWPFLLLHGHRKPKPKSGFNLQPPEQPPTPNTWFLAKFRIIFEFRILSRYAYFSVILHFFPTFLHFSLFIAPCEGSMLGEKKALSTTWQSSTLEFIRDLLVYISIHSIFLGSNFASMVMLRCP